MVALGFVLTCWLVLLVSLALFVGLFADGLLVTRELHGALALAMQSIETPQFEATGHVMAVLVFTAGAWAAARAAPHAPRLHAFATAGFSLVVLSILQLDDGPDAQSEVWHWSTAAILVLSLAAGEQVRRAAPRAGTAPPPGAGPFASLLQNVRLGCALAFFRPVSADAVRASADQVVLLALLNFLVGLGWEWLLTEPPRAFYAEGIAVHGFWLLATLLLAYVASRELPRGLGFAWPATLLLAPLLVGWLGFAALELGAVHSELVAAFVEELYYGQLFAAWLLLVYAPVLTRVVGLPALRACALAATYGTIMMFAFGQLPSVYLWDTVAAAPVSPPAPSIDVEGVLHEQRSRVEAALDRLEPGRPGVVDLYFLGFAADAREDVFMKEVRFVKELLDRRFDTAGRSLVLVNHDESLDSQPLATASNLGDALSGLAEVMDPEEDLLLLHLTGHGSREHELRVKFPGLPLNPVDPERLAGLIARAGIRWPVVVVSACYSGGYVEPLRGGQSLVMTSAAADRVSFGCGAKSERTYFATAYFGGAARRDPRSGGGVRRGARPTRKLGGVRGQEVLPAADRPRRGDGSQARRVDLAPRRARGRGYGAALAL